MNIVDLCIQYNVPHRLFSFFLYERTNNAIELVRYQSMCVQQALSNFKSALRLHEAFP